MIPEDVLIVGTTRSLRSEVQDLIERRLRELVHYVAASFRATATREYERVFPTTINSIEEARVATSVAAELLGAEKVVAQPRPSLGGEDCASKAAGTTRSLYSSGQWGQRGTAQPQLRLQRRTHSDRRSATGAAR